MRLSFIDPGRFRTELALEQAVPTPDEHGGRIDTWTPIASVMALVEPVSARSMMGADQSLETLTHRVMTRARPDLASGMRFVRGQRVLSIVTTHDPDETGRYLVCMTREEGR